MFVYRDWGNRLGKEILDLSFNTYVEAKQALDTLHLPIPKEEVMILAVLCENCNNENDIISFATDEEIKSFILCEKCRNAVFSKRPVGRPSIGITRKVSVTLSDSDWELLDKKAEGNRSAFIREAVKSKLGNES